MLPFIWFCLVALMIAGYVILDGFDLGAGAIHLFVTRSPGRTKTGAAFHRLCMGRK